MPFDEWKREASEHAIALGLPDDLWDEDDPYELTPLAEYAFNRGVTPSTFIDAAFAEDLTRQESDTQQACEALTHEDEYGDQ
jgi:hypothetical protein